MRSSYQTLEALFEIFVQSQMAVEEVESGSAEFGVLPQIVKSLEGQGITFQPGLGAIPAFGEREDLAAETGRPGRVDQGSQGGILYTAQQVVDDGAGIELSGAADEQIVETRRAGFGHASGIEKTKQFMAVVAPLKAGGAVEIPEFLQVPG